MYTKIFLLIILCKRVITDEEEINEKYIDLLPEEEKQEFLNRIARRILEGIRSDNTPNESHADITDDQLNAHDAFVKEILKDESDNLKTNKQNENQEVDGNNNQQAQLNNVERNYNTDEKAVLNTGDLEKIIENQQRRSDTAKADEIDRVEPDNDGRIENVDDKAEYNNFDKAEHIDLTLREGVRQKRKDGDRTIKTETTTEMSYEVIPVKTIYDEENDGFGATSVNENIRLRTDQEGNSTNGNKEEVIEEENSNNLMLATYDFKSDSHNDTDKTDNSEKLIEEDITVSSLGHASNLEVFKNKLLTTSNNINNSENLRKSFHHKVKDLQPSEYTTFLPTTISTKITLRTKNDDWFDTLKINKNEEQDNTNQSNHTSTNNEYSPIKLNEATANAVHNSKISKNESQIFDIINVTNSNEHKEVKLDNSVFETAISDDSLFPKELEPLEKPSITTKLSELHNSSPNSSNTTFDENNEEVVKHKILRKSALEHHSGEVSEIKNNTEKQDSTTKIVGARLDEDLSQIENNYDPFQKPEDSKNVKVYEVFEVGSSQPNFISAGEEKQNEHPLYVPVYNYSPENAYFKPYNKFGPNIVDMKKEKAPETLTQEYSFRILPNTRNRFSGYSYNEKRNSYDLNTKTYDTKSNDNKKTKNLTKDFMKTLEEKIINQNIYYNPHDYGDLDYHYGRILRRDKNPQIDRELENADANSNEKFIPGFNAVNHPISSIHKGDKIKDHVRAVQKILFLKNHFGSKDNENLVRKVYRYSETSDEPKRDSIAIDYYFGRADSEEKPVDMSTIVFGLKNNIINKETNVDISPLTPNPLNFENISKNVPKEILIERYHSNSKEISDVPFKKLLKSLLVVLEDSIQAKNENLVKYDWLKSTVNIQAAIVKLLKLIEQLNYGEYIHPKDLELMKYTIYIFESSKTTLDREANNVYLNKIKNTELQLAKKNNTVQKMPKTKITKIKEPIKLWKNFATFLRSDEIEVERTKYEFLDDFEDFLREIQFYLHDLHDAIKHISTKTEYKNQNWYKDLKDLYLGKGNKKNLAEVILHLSISKLLNSIEDSSVNGVEENFRNFVQKNREDVKKSKDECLFVLKILEELKVMKS